MEIQAQDTGETTVSQPIPAVEKTETTESGDDGEDVSRTAETSEAVADTLSQDSLPPKKDGALKAVVDYYGEDYVYMHRKSNQVHMHNNAYVIYEDMRLDAGHIILDYSTNEVYATGIRDTAGNYVQRPVFVQGTQEVEPDSIRFNFDTKKALVYNSRTQQGEINTIAAISKRENDSVYFMRDVKFTSAKDIDNPEYYFFARKIKMVPGRKIVTGLTNMYIADVPTPLGLPFGYFPLENKRTSGFIIPAFGENSGRGYFFQNGGYYFAASDYADLTVLGDYYTNGSYALRGESAYVWRYKFRGNLSVRFENLVNSERGFPDYSRSSLYNINWQHSQDPKANPSSRFSASVNLGSQRYYQESINQLNAAASMTNTLSSSVSYNKMFEIEPQVNVALTATHSQNTATGEINMTLPTFTADVSQFFPFAPKSGIKKGALQNINLRYNVNAQNRIQTHDSLFMKPSMFEDARTGARHDIPLNTNIKILNYLNLGLTANYQESWVNETSEKYYDEEAEAVVTETVRGFDAFRTYSASASLNTTVYGMFNFGEDKKIQTIRHVMQPSVSWGIAPAFDQYWQELRYHPTVPGDPTTEERILAYSRFEGSLYGAPSNQFSSSVSFALSNTFEAKIRDKDSIDGEPRKRMLLNNFNLSTSYNMAADSLKWNPVSVSGIIPIVERLDLQFQARLDPYALNSNNQRIDTYNINNGGSLFRLTQANMNFGYDFSSKNFQRSSEDERRAQENQNSGGRPDDLFGTNANLSSQTLSQEEDDEVDPTDYTWYRYDMPWDFRIAYSMAYSNDRRQSNLSTHSIMFSGNVELAPRWRVGGNSGFDMVSKKFTHTQLRFTRDLESWNMNFSWQPFSYGGTWFFFVGIKASMFSDIKYDKRRVPDKQL